MLSGKTIMITGASSGIGAATARVLAAEGAAVVLMARRGELLRKVAADITAAGGRAAVSEGDVASSADVERAVGTALDTFGSLDAAFNNAGWGTAGTPLHLMDDADFDRTIDVNVRGVWNCLRHQVRVMMAQPSGGSIVNTGSTAGSFATGAGAPYVAAKHAVTGLTKAAAAEYGGDNIRVNVLMVGSTRTELLVEAMRRVPQMEENAVSRAIQKRLADPEEIAQAVAWLCSDRSSFVTGAVVPVDGGCSAV
ncbi:SDR family NAD(P)-dependent oxidoreductase [Streptomyces sp. TS71-3]|uniref:SDR family NAD(P)-dependent oxidoreductase n=1 Tax=Streptomyces sp. TS71-3 TaxID=2733862 RepID=UPI001BB31FEE|nr:SDR family NAD(P)-dependent oxidoreductase [Streptomyces sp. TS71-3]